MYENKVKKKLKNGGLALGIHVNGSEKSAIEIAGILGFDFIFFDCEHGTFSYPEIENLVILCENRGLVPIVRVGEKTPNEILHYLELGVMGFMFPDVRNADEIKKLIDYTHYYPRGHRSMSCTRAADYAIHIARSDYRKMANEQIIIIPQLESPEAIDNLEEIASVPEVDLIAYGPNDYSQELGIPDQLDDPRILAGQEKIYEISKKYGIPVSYSTNSPDGIWKASEIGASWYCIAYNTLLINTLKGFTDTRKLIADKKEKGKGATD